jgi:hypothetical protein
VAMIFIPGFQCPTVRSGSAAALHITISCGAVVVSGAASAEQRIAPSRGRTDGARERRPPCIQK